MKKIAIVGGGITGLSLAWFLKKQKHDYEIFVFEKNSRVGGVIDTIDEDYFFEKGPRTFAISRSAALLELIHELELDEELIYSRKKQKRYIYKDKKLRTFFQLYPMLKGAIRDLTAKGIAKTDESIYSFFMRRFGKTITNDLIDPFVTGIYAGDIKKLSMKATFGEIAKLEELEGSVIKGWLKNRQKKEKGLFTLKEGLISLIRALEDEANIVYRDCTDFSGFDHVFVTCNFEETKKLFPLVQDYEELSYASLVCVNCAYDSKLMDYDGFGYLVPSIEKEEILGIIFDSCVFPQQSSYVKELRLSVMMGGSHHPQMIESSDEKIKEIVFDALSGHLSLPIPDYLIIHRYPNAVPQYPVGHIERINQWLLHAKEIYPDVTFVSSFIKKPSVNGRIQEAMLAAKEFQGEFAMQHTS